MIPSSRQFAVCTRIQVDAFYVDDAMPCGPKTFRLSILGPTSVLKQQETCFVLENTRSNAALVLAQLH